MMKEVNESHPSPRPSKGGGKKHQRLVDLLVVLWLLFVFGLYLVRFSSEYAAANLGRIAELIR